MASRVFRTPPSQGLTCRRVTERSTSATLSTVIQMCSSSLTASCQRDGAEGRTRFERAVSGGAHAGRLSMNVKPDRHFLWRRRPPACTATKASHKSDGQGDHIIITLHSSSSIHLFFIHDCSFIQHSRSMNPMDVVAAAMETSHLTSSYQ